MAHHINDHLPEGQFLGKAVTDLQGSVEAALAHLETLEGRFGGLREQIADLAQKVVARDEANAALSELIEKTLAALTAKPSATALSSTASTTRATGLVDQDEPKDEPALED